MNSNLQIDTYSLSIYILNFIKPYLENKNLKKIRIGIEIMLINVSKFVIIFSIAYLLGVFKEAIIVIASFGTLRKTIGGIHAKSSARCTVFSGMLIIGGAIFPNLIRLNNLAIALIFLFNILATYKYSPRDTKKNPIKDFNKRKLLRKESLKKIVILFAIVIIIQDPIIKTLITFGATSAVISILPVIYTVCNQTT